MASLFFVFVFIFGTIIGSFLNVVIFRHGTGMGLGGRSRCMTSGKILKWYELIPVVSFLIQRGRSRNTGAKLSWQYPVVELLTGLLFLLSFQKALPFLIAGDTNSFFIFFLFLVFVSISIILVAVYDTKHMIIPHEFMYPLLGLAFVSLFVSVGPLGFSVPSLVSFLSGPILALPFFLLWFFSRGKWMGFADIKIGLALGWFLGISQGFFAVLLGFWLGALVGIFVLWHKKNHTAKNTMIPFGPFLLTGLILTFLYNISIDTFISFLM